MLQYLINVTQTLFPAMLLLVLLSVFVKLQDISVPRKYLGWGVILGGATAFVLATLRITTGFVVRELYNAPLLFVMLMTESLLFVRLIRYRNPKIHTNPVVSLSGFFVFLSGFLWSAFYFPDLLLFVFEFKEDLDCICNQVFLNRVLGYLFAFLIVILAGLSFFQLISRFKRGNLINIFLVSIAIVWTSHLLLFFQIAVLRRWIPGYNWLVELVICLLYYQKIFLYALFIVLIYVVYSAIRKNRKNPIDGPDPALRRKQKMDVKRQIRWAIVLLASVFAMFLILTVGVHATNQEVEIKQPIELLPVDNKIIIPIEKVNDGHLHRFGYTSEDGTQMRYIIIKKGEGTFGIGLDACDVCGPSGYYERDGQIVCALCDVVINISTIGFKGGCNPVPLDFVIENGKIIIKTAALEVEAHRFR